MTELELDELDRLLRQIRIETDLPLKTFVVRSWHINQPDTPFIDNWHIDAICEHLEAVFKGQIRRLIINVPPRHTKSVLVSVDFPAWVWTKNPSKRFLCASYDASLSMDLSVDCRALIESDWYQSRWGKLFRLTSDQNVKSYFKNSKRGSRKAVSLKGGATGHGGNYILIDDPHNAKNADRPNAIREDVKMFRTGLSTRLNNRRDSFIVIGQRLTEIDLFEELMRNKKWEQLVIPTEYDPKRSRVTVIGWKDPRRKAGQLMNPERFGKEEIAQAKVDLLDAGFSAQHQQQPVPPGGNLIKRVWLEGKILKLDPRSVPAYWAKVRYWDLAATEQKLGNDPDYTVGALWAKDENNRLYVLDVVRERYEPADVEQLILNTAQADGHTTAVRIEKEPGASGKFNIDTIVRLLIGYDAAGADPMGSKVSRAKPVAAQAKLGNIYIIEADWNEEWIREHIKFPFYDHDDQVDASSGAVRELGPMMVKKTDLKLAKPF